MRNRILLATLAALLTSAAAVSQAEPYSPPTDKDTAATAPSSTSTSTATSTSSTDASADRDQSTTTTTTTTTMSATSRLQGNDAAFLSKAIPAGREEVADHQDALSNAKRAEVRTLASSMLADHQRANQALEKLAKDKGWEIPAVATTAESDQSRAAGTSIGSDYDAQYLERQIRAHRDAIALFRTEASDGSDPELRQFARDTLPTLEHHLSMLQGSHTQK